MGGDETRNAQAFRTLSSLVHESDSDLRDSLWLSSSRIGCARSAFFYGGQYCHGSFVTGRDDAARGAAPRQ